MPNFGLGNSDGNSLLMDGSRGSKRLGSNKCFTSHCSFHQERCTTSYRDGNHADEIEQHGKFYVKDIVP